MSEAIRKMQAAAAALEEAACEVEAQTGRKVCLFAESGKLYLIDSARDAANCDGKKERAIPYKKGGSILAYLGGTHFDGGGW